MNKNSLITIAGILWGVIGLFLIFRGVGLYQLAVNEQHSTQNTLIFSVIAGLVIGGAKGLFVLSKTARKNKIRIEKLDAPLKIHHIFSKPFYGFIALMMLLGILLRHYNEYLGGYIVVAAIYCGIGMALMVGSRAYWKSEPEAAIEEAP
ncbi:MAG: hypothetical protein ACE5EK_07400 [Nitrospinales bacterium]